MKKSLTIVSLNRVDILTLSGMFLSCCSCALALKGQYAFSMSFLFMAMLADAFDGILARKYGLTRDFGRYLDGFVDVFDYLVVPSIFLYMWGFNTWYDGLILVLFMMSGIVRLSVFNEIGNINEGDGLSYLGMPVFWSVLGLGGIYILSWITGKAVLFPLIAILLVLFSAMMVYNRPFYKFKNPKTIFMFVFGCAILFFLQGLVSSFKVDLSIHIHTALFFILPLVVGGSLHMLTVKKDWFPFLKIPVHNAWFGANKTWRGFIMMPLFTILGAFMVRKLPDAWAMSADLKPINWVFMGIVLGLAYAVSELPNSFIKRRMGAEPGELPGNNRLFFMMMDQTDAAIGGTIAVTIIYHLPLATALTIVVLTPMIALGVKRILYILKLKKSYA